MFLAPRIYSILLQLYISIITKKLQFMKVEKSVLDLAKRIRNKYTKKGQLWDGGLSDSLIKYVGRDSRVEEALMDAYRIMKVVSKQYKSNKKFRSAIDSDLFLKNGVGASRILKLKQFQDEIYNYYVPGYLEMLRMEKDPSNPLFAENLEYFEGLYIDEDWKADL